MVTLCGRGAGVGEYAECQIVAALPSSTLLAGNAAAWSLAEAIQPVVGKGAARLT
jgi:hypothetical protein